MGYGRSILGRTKLQSSDRHMVCTGKLFLSLQAKIGGLPHPSFLQQHSPWKKLSLVRLFFVAGFHSQDTEQKQRKPLIWCVTLQSKDKNG